ncbi:MAG: imidazoleglycerol-phosphate dehydratase HisB [Actinomycetota bacterium]|nr:imidazoleglycerol-phosphate dehydratase HisB [Actinomycetota bacterium]
MAERRALIERTTTETSVKVALDLDGGPVACATGVAFFDHMLDQLGRHSHLGLEVEARGDLAVDAHHTVEDVGIVLGQALGQALGDRRGIRRYGWALVPMEESLASVALDLSGRALLVYRAEVAAEVIGSFDVSLAEEFFMALCRTGGLTLHVRLLESRNAHHGIEAIFKAVARALSDAVSAEPRAAGEVPSTKGVL